MENTPDNIAAHISGLRRYAMALVRNAAEADDLVQECLCRTIERARSWRKINDVRSYLFTTLHNLYIDTIVKKRQRYECVPDEVIERKLTVAPCQLHRIEVRDLSRAMDRLPAEQREVLLLVGLEGLTYEAAARVADVPIGTVMSRLSRARESLRRQMDGENRNDDEFRAGRANGQKLDKSDNEYAISALRSRG